MLREENAVLLTLGINTPTPYSVYTIHSPPRLILDFGDVDLSNMPNNMVQKFPEFSGLRYGFYQLDEARIVLDMAKLMVVKDAFSSLSPLGDHQINIRMVPAGMSEFADRSSLANASIWQPEQLEPNIEGEAGLPLIAIDAGHGGLDDGARQGEIVEKDIVLQVATRLRDLLLEDGRFRVILTRDADVYIPLGERVEIARRAGARAFISLHADVVTLGRARGTTVFSLSEAGEDQQAVTIATLENRSDLVAGISVEGEDDQLTQVLLQLAHRETDALSNRFADTMAEALWFHNEIEVKSRRMAGGFRVLRAPDIPSVLIELGFMSDKTDLENLQDPVWQHDMAENLRNGLSTWLQVEDEMRGLLRN